MTALVAWVGADSRGPASLNIAADSRITWRPENSSAHHWDQGKKVFASSSVPLVIGFVGDVLFPASSIGSTAACSGRTARSSRASSRRCAADGGTIPPLSAGTRTSTSRTGRENACPAGSS